MLNDFIVRHKSTFSDFMEIYVEIFSTSTEFFSECSSETFNKCSLEIFSRYSSEIFPKCSSEIFSE
jgi:hypothetical protein